ncbi:MAG TPA: GMC family oxidoreductase [Burkholderiales bacterium]|nr:GMC family oxidoreductase [Burkholderiales bacterium]
MAKQYDVVIIGAGAGGGTCAWALTQKKMKVLVLEAGPEYDPFKDYKIDTPDWEKGFPYKPGSQGKYTYGAMQPLAERWNHLRSWNHISGRLNPGRVRISNGYQHVRGVGGSSLHFTGEAHRLNPRSMAMRTKFGVAADWPFSYEELEPYYVTAEKVVGVAGPAKESSRPRSAPYPYPAHPSGYCTTLLRQGFKKKGLGLVDNALAVLPQARGERPPCNYCNCCLKGCPRTDKGSIDVTYLRDAVASGFCDILSESIATRIETTKDDRVRGVHYRDKRGTHFIEAPILILAGGAIETPRLLLASQDSRSPQGLANESGQVGRNFMETLLWISSALHPDPIGSHRGLPVDSICWDYNAPDAIPGVVGGCRISPSVAESDLIGPVNYARRVVKGWGRSHKESMRKTFGRVLSLSGICESLPHKNSYVDLDADTKDASGVPVARIHSFVDDMAVKRIEFMAGLCRDVLAAAGASNVFEEVGSYDIFSSTHVFGTCRMGKDEKASVVDADCRSHRWKNLYIVDASVFPSSGGGESPGLTIQALALRAMGNMLPRRA